MATLASHMMIRNPHLLQLRQRYVVEWREAAMNLEFDTLLRNGIWANIGSSPLQI
jgi:hypothetical protein